MQYSSLSSKIVLHSSKEIIVLRLNDHLIEENKLKKIKAIEVKSGNVTQNKMQIIKDQSMELYGGKIIGKNAPLKYRNKVLKIETEVRR